MANTIKIKRGSGSDPSASDMVLGEPVLRTDTAELFFKKDDGSVAKVSGGGGGPDFKYLALRNAANNGAASYPNADFTLVTSGTTNAKIPSAANTLLVSVNGVIQKPNTGTSTPSAGFAISGSTIKFAANISAAPDFILYQESGGIGEPSDETVSEAKLQVSNSPVNGYFLSAQSGNTGGLTWAAPVATSCTGNSATATALATARAINGVNFDGTAAITVTAAAGTLTGNTLNSSVTASSLTSLGDLSGLTVDGNVVINDRIIHSGDTNTQIRFPATDTFSVETAGLERLRVTSSGKLFLGTTNSGNSSADNFTIADSGESGITVRSGTSNGGHIYFSDATSGTAQYQGLVSYQHNGDFMKFGTSATERMRIDSSGRVLIGTTTEGFATFGDTFTLASSAHTGITVRSGTTHRGSIFFSDATSGDAEKEGFVQYNHDDGRLVFGTTQTERVRIDGSGNVGIGTTSPSTKLHVNGTVTATAYAGDGSALTGISAGATGGGSDEIFYENSQAVTTDYTITSGKNAMSAGPITINNGVSVTVPSGSTYTIV